MKNRVALVIAAVAAAAAAGALVVGCATTKPPECEQPLVVQREIEAAETQANLFRLARQWMANTLVGKDEGIRHENREQGTLVGRGTLTQRSGGALDAVCDFPYDVAVRLTDGRAAGRITVGYGVGEMRAGVMVVTEAHLMSPASYQELKTKVDSKLDEFAVYLENGVRAMEHDSRGVSLAQRGDYQGAMREFDRAIAQDPSWPDAYDHRGIVRRRLGDPEGAIEDHTRALELDPASYSAYTNRGNAKAALGDAEGAIADLTRAIEIVPDHFGAYYNRAAVREDCGDYDGAVEDLTRSIVLNPGHTAALNNRGWIYVKQGKYGQAALDLSRALAAQDDPTYLDTRGWAYFFLGRLEEARQDALAALHLEPGAFNVRALLYRIEALRGDPERALASLRAYVDQHRARGAEDEHFLVLRHLAGEVPRERLQASPKWDDLRVALRDY